MTSTISQPIIYFYISEKHTEPEIKYPTKGVSQAHPALFLISDLWPGQQYEYRGIVSAGRG